MDGLNFKKYFVRRGDNRDLRGGDRHGAEYFVLDLTYDPHAIAAFAYYGVLCRETNPKLAEDIERTVARLSQQRADSK